MSRQQGAFIFSGNFENQLAAPLDTRLVANTVSDLTDTNYWISGDGNVYLYEGIAVSVWNDSDPNENGIYVLLDSDYTNINNWLKVSGSGDDQVRSITATSSDGVNYTALSTTTITSYVDDMIFLTTFLTTNMSSTVSIDIDSLGQVDVFKTSTSGLTPLNPGDLKSDIVYTLLYDGDDFQLTIPDTGFVIKNNIALGDYIVIPVNHQYWVYGDLTFNGGTIQNDGQIVISGGDLVINSGGLTGFGDIIFTGGLTTSFVDSDTIEFDVISDQYGMTVSAGVINGSLTASKLDTGGQGATAGYLLSVESDGTFKWVENTKLSYSDKNFIVSSFISGEGSFTGLTVSGQPAQDSYVQLFVNGLEYKVSGSTAVGAFYFSDDTGLSAKLNIEQGDSLYYNQSFGFGSIETGFILRLNYLEGN